MHLKRCPGCGITLSIDQRKKEGDVIVCGHCGTISRFDDDMSLFVIGPDELGEFSIEDPEQYKTIELALWIVKHSKELKK